MSTDYGLRCVECNKDLVLEGLHKWGAEIALHRRALIRALYVSAVALEADVSIYWLPDGAATLEQLADFIAVHEEHTLTVVDEYGKVCNE